MIRSYREREKKKPNKNKTTPKALKHHDSCACACRLPLTCLTKKNKNKLQKFIKKRILKWSVIIKQYEYEFKIIMNSIKINNKKVTCLREISTKNRFKF